MPGGKICSVAICRSNSQRTKEKGENIMFFSFPKDPNVRNEWVKRCFRKDAFSPKYKRVCSKHFTLEDFEDKLKASLMGTQPKKLKRTAIPTLLINPAKLGCEFLPERKECKIIPGADIPEQVDKSDEEIADTGTLEIHIEFEDS